MLEKKIKWPNNASSPVLFFIDDLSNLWIDINGDNEIQPEEDWGYAGFSSNGAFNFLENEILSQNSDIKVTFFTPVGIREPVIKNFNVNRIAHPINHDEKMKNFLKTIHKNPKYEVAYHGTTHGLAGKVLEEFKQEWENFKSLEMAISTIKKGKEMFKQAIGEYPRGGKYCGYRSNEYSDESIDKSAFLWWCRYWQPGAVEHKIIDQYETGQDDNPFTAYLPKFFGENNVVDIPSTFSGAIYGKLLANNKLGSLKNCLKRVLRPYLKMKLFSRLKFFIDNNLVISIQEHISPSREDFNRQSPNIFDDRLALRDILFFLKKQRVWYCTGTELSNWVSQ
jgi:hypothetical protein